MNDALSKTDISSINEILKERHYNVNNDDTYKVNNTNNVNNAKSDKDRALDELLALYKDKPEGIARAIAEKLNDLDNLNFHIKTARCNDPHILFEALSSTLDAFRRGEIKTTMARYYVGVLKRKGARW